MIVTDTLKQFFAGIWKKVKDGDKTIWMVLIFLIFFSIVSIFSSTSLLAIKKGVSRFVIFREHLAVVGAGLAVVFFCMLCRVKFFKWCSQWGYGLSVVLLCLLVGNVKIGNVIRVINLNEASRAINVLGFNLQVYEVVKVAMVMYLSWAVECYEKDSFTIVHKFARKWPRRMGWIAGSAAQRWIYIFIPLLSIPMLIVPGSAGSAALTFIVMMVTLLVGGLKWSDIIKAGALGAACLVVVAGVHIVSNGKVFTRIETVSHRVGISLPYPDKGKMEEQRKSMGKKEANPDSLRIGSKEWYEYIDKIKQPDSAELALIQGGRRIIGKLPGKSTQKYVVPVMFEDYMFSFIMEEYGLLGGLFIIILYMSLFARGMILVHNCGTRYTRACLGGLVFLITFQAFFHIIVNCNIGVVTGQTLPMISHGRCSFLCFSLAFGIILSISEKVYNKVRKQQKEEIALMAADDVQSGVTMVENIDSEEYIGQNIAEDSIYESDN